MTVVRETGRDGLELLLQQVRPLAEAVPDGLVITDQRGRIVAVNRRMLALTGYAEKDLIRAPVEVLVPPDARRSHVQQRREYAAAPALRATSGHLPITCRRVDGTAFPADIALSPVHLGGQALVVAAVRDTSDREEAARARREAEQKYALLVEQAEELAGLGVWMRDLTDGGPLVLSPIARSICGFAPEDLVSEADMLARIHPADRGATSRLAELPARGDWHGELRLVLPRHAARWVAAQVRLLRRDDGTPYLLLGSLMDITRIRQDRERVEAHAEEQARLARMARLALINSGLRPVARSAARVAARAVGAEIAILARVDGDHLVRIAAHGLPRHAARRVLMADVPVAARALAAPRGVAIADRTHGEIAFGSAARGLGVNSAVAVALGDPAAPHGVLVLLSRELKRYTTSAVREVRSIADIVSVAIERARADEDLRSTILELTRVDGERRALLARVASAQDEERHRIAADLHDDVVQLLSAVNLRFQILRSHSEASADRNVEEIQNLTMQAIRRLRQMLFELHPPELERHGLVAALEAQLEQAGNDPELRTHLLTSVTWEPTGIARTVLFRIFKEVLQNVRAHSGATAIEVDIQTRGGGTFIRVHDNGRGFQRSRPAAGHVGLTVMEERARGAGGWWRISGEKGRGTTVEFWVPGLQSASPSSNTAAS